jgi:hypothetical protein
MVFVTRLCSDFQTPKYDNTSIINIDFVIPLLSYTYCSTIEILVFVFYPIMF